MLKYYSTNHRSSERTFREALLQGLAPDGGLYMPGSVPSFIPEQLEELAGKDYPEIAFTVLNRFIGEEIKESDLYNICSDAYDFAVPLEKVSDNIYVMRLDQGPTASFKDFAARMMSRLMQHFLSLDNKHLTILTATSGDTGSAVANAFYRCENIDVVILFPGNEVTEMQRRQMTTLKENIKVIDINGKFDDCQRIVKKAFLDPSLSHLSLSSANSINIGRLLPQASYYFYAWANLCKNRECGVVFSVPAGNFGNLMGGLLAREMGLPVSKFIIATNENDEVPVYFKSGIYNPIDPSKDCISSAMNVGHPSNLARIIALYGGIMDEKGIITKEPDIENMRNDFLAISVTDKKTRETMADIYRQHNVILEPHGATAWYGLMRYFEQSKETAGTKETIYISLETAHPAKFPDELKQIINLDPEMPQALKGVMEKEEEYISLENDYQSVQEYILNNIKN